MATQAAVSSSDLFMITTSTATVASQDPTAITTSEESVSSCDLSAITSSEESLGLSKIPILKEKPMSLPVLSTISSPISSKRSLGLSLIPTPKEKGVSSPGLSIISNSIGVAKTPRLSSITEEDVPKREFSKITTLEKAMASQEQPTIATEAATISRLSRVPKQLFNLRFREEKKTFCLKAVTVIYCILMVLVPNKPHPYTFLMDTIGCLVAFTFNHIFRAFISSGPPASKTVIHGLMKCMSYINEVMIFRFYMMSVLVTFGHSWTETLINEYPNLMCTLTDSNEISFLFMLNFLCMMVSKCLLLWKPIAFQAMDHERALKVLISILFLTVMFHSIFTLVICGRLGQRNTFQLFVQSNNLNADVNVQMCNPIPIGALCVVMIALADLFLRITSVYKNLKSNRKLFISKTLGPQEIKGTNSFEIKQTNQTEKSTNLAKIITVQPARYENTLTSQDSHEQSSDSTQGIMVMETAGPETSSKYSISNNPVAVNFRENYSQKIPPKKDSGLEISDAMNKVGMPISISKKKKKNDFVEVNSFSYKPGNLTGLVLMLAAIFGLAANCGLINSKTVLPLIINTIGRVLSLFPAAYWVVFNENSCQYFIRKLEQRLF